MIFYHAEKIKKDIDDRKGMMLKIKTSFFRYSFSSKDEVLFRNYFVPAIYAIWEGFIQSSFREYITTINEFQIKKEDLCDAIFIFHAESTFKQLKEYPKDHKKKILFFNQLNNFYKSEHIKISESIDTESNVGFVVLNKKLESFNLKKSKNMKI